jgi:opacity protein-like surface antigen
MKHDVSHCFKKEIQMKQILIASLLVLATATASALEVGVSVGNNYAKNSASRSHEPIIGPMQWSNGTDRTEYGITIGEKFGRIGITAGFARSNGGTPITIATDGPYKDQIQDRYSLVAGYDVAKFGTVTVTPKLGVAYLDNARDSNGYAITVGAGVSMPVTKKITIGLDYARQYGQDRVNQFNGNRIALGTRYAF